jgi:hypothetical protein
MKMLYRFIPDFLQTSPKNDSDVLTKMTYSTGKLMLLIKLVWNPYHGKEESWVGGMGSQSPEPSWIFVGGNARFYTKIRVRNVNFRD